MRPTGDICVWPFHDGYLIGMLQNTHIGFRPCDLIFALQVWSVVGQKTWGLRSKLPPPAHTAMNYVTNWFQTPR